MTSAADPSRPQTSPGTSPRDPVPSPAAAGSTPPQGSVASAAPSDPSVRRASLRRTTRETDVVLTLDLDGTGQADVKTGIGFYDHLLTSLAHHALVDLAVGASGDLHVDEHHTVEDVALLLGEAVSRALGDRAGIRRFGDASVPMDDALATCALDLSGRPYAVIDLAFPGQQVGTMSTQNVPHVLEAFARTAGATLHLRAAGRNDHHIAEAAFKALARALREAVERDPRRTGVASTKGTLTADGRS